MFKKYFFNLSLKIGLLGALGHLLYFFVFYFTDTEACDSIYYADFWIPTVFIIILIKFYRDKLNGGELRFWEGLTLGTQVSFWTALLAGIFIFIFLNWFDTSFFTECMEKFQAYNLSIKEKVIAQHGESTYNTATEELKKITLSGLIIKKFIFSFMINLISVILFSVLFRR